jgi:hypothetical protein
VEEDGKGDHLDAHEHGLDAEVDVRVGQVGSLFEDVGRAEDPEYDLGWS